MRGYGEDTYGEAFADVYDDWYAQISDIDATVAFVERYARDPGPAHGRILELGIGTGRLAIPLAARGLEVHGVDASPAMLARLGAKPGSEKIVAVQGDMVDDAPPGPFSVVLAAYNTWFNLLDATRQHTAMAAMAHRLVPGGRLIIEAFVPEDPAPAGERITVRTLTAEAVVLSISRDDPDHQRSEGQFVELVHGQPVRLRPWSIRWSRPDELDRMASDAGFELEGRFGDVDGREFDETCERHVSVYRRLR